MYIYMLSTFDKICFTLKVREKERDMLLIAIVDKKKYGIFTLFLFLLFFFYLPIIKL